ncbi:MAG: cytochrome-c oxidase [Alphaproteobacteria bacterium]|nr:cytochrome-c oxidase [Alphaproteobacteria bacterium]
MPTTPSAFFRAAVTYSVLGLMLGLHMAATHDHAQHVTHAHIMLIGWVSIFLYGAYLKLHPGAGAALVPILWWLANVGLVILVGGLLTIYGGNPAGGEIYATIGSFIVFGGFALFAFIVWRNAD